MFKLPRGGEDPSHQNEWSRVELNSNRIISFTFCSFWGIYNRFGEREDSLRWFEPSPPLPPHTHTHFSSQIKRQNAPNTSFKVKFIVCKMIPCSLKSHIDSHHVFSPVQRRKQTPLSHILETYRLHTWNEKKKRWILRDLKKTIHA